MKKRVLAVVLAMAMVLGTITLPVAAATVSTDDALANAVTSANAGDTIEVSGDIIENGTVTIDKDITITGTGTVTLSHAIAVNAGGTLTITGDVTLQGNGSERVITVNGGTLNMQGGIITNGNSNNGGGVKLENNAVFIMSGGKITGNSSTGAGGVGGGVSVTDGSTFTMSDGEISHNTAAQFGGGIDLRRDSGGNCTFTMSGGIITENTVSGSGSYDGGGGVRNDNCTFTMTNGQITNNHAPNALGGGVLLYNAGINRITGGSITGNDAGGNDNGDGGGVHLLWSNMFTLGGTVDITGNTNGTNEASDIYLSNGKMIELEDLAPGSQVGIITQTTPDETTTRVQFAQNGNPGDDAYFDRNVLTFPGYILQEGSDLYLVYDNDAYAAVYDGKYYDTVVEALEVAEADDGNGGDVEVNPNYTGTETDVRVPENVTLVSGGVTIKGSEVDNEITIDVADAAIVVTGGQGIVEVSAGTTVEIGGKEYTASDEPSDNKAVLSVDLDTDEVILQEGSLNLALGESVMVIDGVTYTGDEPDGGSIMVGQDGSITTTGNLRVEIDPEEFNDPDFEYTLLPGVPVTVGSYVYEAEASNAVKLSGELQNGDGENKGNPIVTLTNADDKVTVSVSDGNGGKKPDTDKTYTAANADTKFTMHEPENTADSNKVDLLDNGGAAGTNSALKFEADPNNGNKVPDANVNGMDYTDATDTYTVEYNAVEKTDENGDPELDEDGNPVTIVQNKVTANDTVKATFAEVDQRLTVDGVTTADGSDKPVVAANAGVSILINGTKTGEKEIITGVVPTVVDFGEDKITAKWQTSPVQVNSYYLVVGPNGSASVTPQRASAGQIVTITATPNQGYEVEQVTVIDRNGNPVPVISVGGNQYTFVQPADAPVEIRVTFAKSGAVYDQCTKDENCPIHPFVDTSATAWYHDGVHYVLDEGIMVGTSATTFQPYDTATRGTIVTMLWRMMKTPEVNYNMTFGDVPAGTWYTEAVRWAAANDIVKGYSSTAFGPNDAITREQLATILYRYAEYRGYDVSARANLNSFVDHDQIGDYAAEALAWANAKGLIIGTDTNALAPKAQATRAEIATIIMRFCEGIAK